MPHIHFSPFSNRNLTIFYTSSTIFTKSARRTPQPNPHKSLFQASKTKNAQKRPKFPLFRSHLNNYPPTIRKRSHSHGNGQKSNHVISGRSPHILHVPFATDARAWEVCWDSHQNFLKLPTQDRLKTLTRIFPDPDFEIRIFGKPVFLPTEISNPKTAAATRPSGERGTACGGEPHLKALLLSPRKKCFGSFPKRTGWAKRSKNQSWRFFAEGSMPLPYFNYPLPLRNSSLPSPTLPYRYETVPYVTKGYETVCFALMIIIFFFSVCDAVS